jgi:hypothetical protein
MATAPNALSQSQLVSNVVDDLSQLSQSNQTGNSSSVADPNGPFAKLIADLQKLIQSLQSQNGQWQPGTEMPPNGSHCQPTPYSTSSLPSGVQQDPMSQFSQQDLNRAQSMASHLPNLMPNAIRSGNGPSTGFHPTVSAANFAPPVADLRTNAGVTDHRVGAGVPPSTQPRTGSNIETRDHRTGAQDPTTTATINTRDHRTTTATVIPDSNVTESVDPTTGAIVRDHMHPISTGDGAANVGWATPPSQTPPSQTPIFVGPPVSAPPSVGPGGTAFTSGADYSSLNSANSDLESAKQAALADPTNPAKQLAFQEAAQKLQLTFNLLQQLSSMKASMADAAIKNIKVNAA